MKEAAVHSVPDFSGWKMTDEVAAIWDFKGKKLTKETMSAQAAARPGWIGTIRRYELGAKLAKGFEYDIFDRQVLVKFWGLGDEAQLYHDFSVFCNGRWQTFTADIHEPRIIPNISKVGGEERVVACKILAVMKGSGATLMATEEIKRNKPAQ